MNLAYSALRQPRKPLKKKLEKLRTNGTQLYNDYNFPYFKGNVN